MDKLHFVYPLTSLWMGCFHLLSVIHKNAINIHVRVFICENRLSILLGMGLRDHMVTPSLTFLRNYQTVFKEDETPFRIPISNK